MPGPNGRTDLVGPAIQLGDFLPERREVILNGQKYTAWVVTNRRYPRSIMARLDRAARDYNRIVLPLLTSVPEGEEPSEEWIKAAEEQPEAWANYLTKATLLLTPGLQEGELELVDVTTLENLLRELGYLAPREPDAEAETPAETAEATAEAGDPLPADSTGDSPQLDLLGSTSGPAQTSS